MKNIIVILMIVILCSGIVFAETETEKEIFNKLFTVSESEFDSLFHSSFLEQVSVSEVTLIVNNYKNNLGELVEMEHSGEVYTLIFEKGSVPAEIVLNSDNKIVALWFGNYTLKQDNLEDIIAEFKDLSGEVSICVVKNNDEIVLSYNKDEYLASASSFKLFVLKELYDYIESTESSWEEVVLLNNENKSLPTGILQEWPEASPVTLKTLSNLMISISDNTASDHLIDFLGREKIEDSLSDRNSPFLKTNELFKLKYTSDMEFQNRFIKGNEEEKRQLLEEVKTIDINSIEFKNNPQLIDELEWFFTTEKLCQIIYQLKDADEIMINPGLVDKEKWKLAGYKGGSEPGVLQYTHLLQKDKYDDIYAVSVTVNNPLEEVDVNKTTELTLRLIDLIEKGEI